MEPDAFIHCHGDPNKREDKESIDYVDSAGLAQMMMHEI